MSRVSPASQLVLLVVALAAILSFAAIGRRPPAASATPSGTAGSLAARVPTAIATEGSASSVGSPTGATGGSPPPATSAQLGTAQRPPSQASASPAPSSPSSPSAAPRSSSSPRPAGTPGPAGTPIPTPQAGELTLAQLLARLPTAPERRTGYDRDLFKLWIDADGDGCDTRHEVLIAEAVATPTVGARCSLSGGRWFSAYDGLTFTDPSKLDIDHLVPLAEAWDSGAYAWNADRRERYANDLDVPWTLIAVSASTNRSKGDDDPAEWLPPRTSYECTYLGDWLAVKARWDLSVDATERSAIEGLIGGCAGTDRPVVPAP